MRIEQHLVALTGVGQQPEGARSTQLHVLGKSGVAENATTPANSPVARLVRPSGLPFG